MDRKEDIRQWLVIHVNDAQHVLRHPLTPDTPGVSTIELSVQFREQLLAGSLYEGSLTQALAYVCFWLTAIAYASGRDSARDRLNGPLVRYSYCAQLLTATRDAWIAAGYPLTDFQPSFIPAAPPPGV